MQNEITKYDLIYLGIIVFVALSASAILKIFESSWINFATNILRSLI